MSRPSRRKECPVVVFDRALSLGPRHGVALFALLVGCKSPHASRNAHDDATALSQKAAPARAVLSAAPAASPVVVPAGMADLTPPSPAATKANDDAVALLSKGKIEPAIAGFEKALALSPSFVLARYNLACARARASDFDGSERELAAVFEIDWVGLRAQAAKDDDLAAFRSSPQGKRLFAREAALEGRYKPALERGVRVMYWLAKSADDIEADGIRIGVWDATTARFIPTSERRRGTLSGYVSSDLPYGVLLTGSIPKMLGGDMSDHLTVKDLSFWSFDAAGTALGTTKLDKGAFSGALDLEGDTAVLAMHSAQGYDNPARPSMFELSTTFAPSVGPSKTTYAEKLEDRPRPDPKKACGQLALHFHNGFETWSASPGYTYNDKTRALSLPSGKTIEIPKTLPSKPPIPTKPSIAASPKGDLVVLSWPAHSCGDACGGDIVTVGAHRIVLVDTATGAVKKIAEGTGIGAARFDPSGRLFIQRDRKTFDVGGKPEDPSSWKELPNGLVLVAPVIREDSIQCCGF